jgi:two-component system, NtrC family, sensor kinase
LQAETDEYPESSDGARRFGYHTILAVPLIRASTATGVIVIRRTEVRPFSERQIELVNTFADQAVIAIENTRLFEQVQARNYELRVAAEQQTARSKLLKIIGRSTLNLQPVFETLAENAVRLCEAERSFIHRFDGQSLRVVATHNASPELRAFVEQNPIAPERGSATARAALERPTVQVLDAQADPGYSQPGRFSRCRLPRRRRRERRANLDPPRRGLTQIAALYRKIIALPGMQRILIGRRVYILMTCCIVCRDADG